MVAAVPAKRGKKPRAATVAAPQPTPASAPSPPTPTPTPIQPAAETSATQESLGLKLDKQLKVLVRVGYPL